MKQVLLSAGPRQVTYADLGGIDNVLSDIKELIEHPLQHPEVMTNLEITGHGIAMSCYKALLCMVVCTADVFLVLAVLAACMMSAVCVIALVSMQEADC